MVHCQIIKFNFQPFLFHLPLVKLKRSMYLTYLCPTAALVAADGRSVWKPTTAAYELTECVIFNAGYEWVAPAGV